MWDRIQDPDENRHSSIRVTARYALYLLLPGQMIFLSSMLRIIPFRSWNKQKMFVQIYFLYVVFVITFTVHFVTYSIHLHSTVLFNSIFFSQNVGHPCKFLRQHVNDAKEKRVMHCQAVRRSSIENREIQDFFFFFLLNSVFATLYVSYILESTSAGSSCSRSFLKLLTYQTSRSLPKYHLSLSLMISPSFC